jgi:hypothetical protein
MTKVVFYKIFILLFFLSANKIFPQDYLQPNVHQVGTTEYFLKLPPRDPIIHPSHVYHIQDWDSRFMFNIENTIDVPIYSLVFTWDRGDSEYFAVIYFDTSFDSALIENKRLTDNDYFNFLGFNDTYTTMILSRKTEWNIYTGIDTWNRDILLAETIIKENEQYIHMIAIGHDELQLLGVIEILSTLEKN